VLIDPAKLTAGDVLAVSTSNSNVVEEVIKIGGVLAAGSGLDNHVVVMHHWTDGVPWGVEGKPGGVGWADLRRYLHDPYTVGNPGQPKSDAQRAEVARLAETMLGTPYDWAAIADDGLTALHLPRLFSEDWSGEGAPGHVVCSSLAAWLYRRVGLAHPGVHPDRLTTPSDWTEFCLTATW
jgi:hypothetical protein